jgi:hypothetical protein
MKTFLISLSILLTSFNQIVQKQNTVAPCGSVRNECRNFKTYTWYDELCRYTGKYDPTRVTYKQLKNSYDLGYHTDRFRITTLTFTFDQIDMIDLLNVDSLDKEYFRKLNDLKRLEVINSRYWLVLKQNKIKELTKVYELSRLNILGYKYPDTLNYKGCPAECKKYVKGLVKGGNELLKVWKELHKEHSAKYGNNEFANKIFYENYNSIDNLKYAQMDVISYGWWNCVNNTIPYVDDSDFQTEYLKNFTDVKEDCNEP